MLVAKIPRLGGGSRIERVRRKRPHGLGCLPRYSGISSASRSRVYTSDPSGSSGAVMPM
jgi:hypothetical protein